MRQASSRLYRKIVADRQQILPSFSPAGGDSAPNVESDAQLTGTNDRPVCYTLGHSTRSLDEFCQLLEENQVEQVLDVRRYPGSRRFPHFQAEVLAEQLQRRGIDYLHLPQLGGRRQPRSDSSGGYWRTAGFRGYADYLQSAEFQAAFRELLQRVASRRSVLICAEALPWRCHRQLIADVLVAHGVAVEHILAAGKRQAHQLNPHARLAADGSLVYVA